MAGECRKPAGKYHQLTDHREHTVASKLRKTADATAEYRDPFRTKIPFIAHPIAAIRARISGGIVALRSPAGRTRRNAVDWLDETQLSRGESECCESEILFLRFRTR